MQKRPNTIQTGLSAPETVGRLVYVDWRSKAFSQNEIAKTCRKMK